MIHVLTWIQLGTAFLRTTRSLSSMSWPSGHHYHSCVDLNPLRRSSSEPPWLRESARVGGEMTLILQRIGNMQLIISLYSGTGLVRSSIFLRTWQHMGWNSCFNTKGHLTRQKRLCDILQMYQYVKTGTESSVSDIQCTTNVSNREVVSHDTHRIFHGTTGSNLVMGKIFARHLPWKKI